MKRIFYLASLILLLGIETMLTAASLSYQDYLLLDENKVERIIDKYVKEKDDRFILKLNHYEVISDVSKPVVLEIAVLMDDFFGQFNEKFKGKMRKKGVPKIFVMKSKSSYQSMIKEYSDLDAPDWSAGLFVGGRRSALYCNYSIGDYAIQVMKHEGLHQLLDAYIDGTIPPWFNEGTATVFETFNMANSMNMNIALNLFKSRYPNELLKQGVDSLIPLSELIKVSGRMWNEKEDPSLCYLSSWCVVHYLLSTKDGIGIYNKILTAMRKRSRVSKVLTTSLVANLEKKVEDHVAKIILPFARCIKAFMEANGSYIQKENLLEGLMRDEPDSPHVNFYKLYFDLHEDKKIDAKKYLEILEGLQDTGYLHPEMDYLLGLAWIRMENKSKPRYYFRRQLANWPSHELSIKQLAHE
jgi:hypothetical protein